ncbi:MAG TPA: copper chaperone PCu(A)C [Gemmatimonadales bacterium]|nr:copper chaperone PCu(A)C [Gemmatimonadales bacterium]
MTLRLALMAVVTLAACAPPAPRALAARDGIAVTAGHAFAPPTQGEAAAYVSVVNRGRDPDTLLGVGSPMAGGAMVHRQVAEGGVVRMEHVDALPLAPGDSVVMAPGGLHIMLTSLESVPEPGDSIALVLRLARAGELAVTIPVRAYGEEP